MYYVRLVRGGAEAEKQHTDCATGYYVASSTQSKAKANLDKVGI